MHIALAVITLLAGRKWGDWRNWRLYYPTMMYFAMGNLLYNFLCANHFLWKLHGDVLPNHCLTEMLYTFIIFPATALLFLSNYPKTRMKKLKHYATWVLIYAGTELFFYYTGRIYYQFGWGYWWSVLFDCIMFPMLRLFYLKPLWAFGVSAVFTFVWVSLFDVPVDVPIELRK